MAFQIITLMENTSPTDCLAAEHGLSLLIQGEGRKVLYDTGASPRFLLNAKNLGVDLHGLDALVLSHGHYDHTGGAAALLAGSLRPRTVYLGRDFFGERYVRRTEGVEEIGSLLERDTLERSEIPWTVVGEKPLDLGGGMWLVSGFTSTEEVERPSPRMLRRVGGQMVTDPFTDEVAVVLEGREGLTLSSGCAHVGILSMCARAAELFGRPVTGFVGGTHLMAADDDRVRYTCDRLRERGMTRLGACHCSGERASAYFQEHFPGFFRNNVGSRVEIQ